MRKTATLTETKIAQAREVSANVRDMLELSETDYFNTEFETGLTLLYNTIKPHPNRVTLFRKFSTTPELGFWNWWINYRQQQECSFMREAFKQGFENLLEMQPDNARMWLRRNWSRIHNEIAVSEVAIYACGEFIKHKL